MATLLVVHHSPTGSVRRLTEGVLAGAGDEAIEGVTVVERAALDPDADELLAADAVVLVTPANFGYMSGALKHYLDTVFLEVGGALADDGGAGDGGGGRRLPFGLVVHGRYDTTGAERSVLAIVKALGWRQSADVLAVLGDVGEQEVSAAYELGATLAALAGEG
ncbi:flavodoxin family protein [Nostocoides sp. F2B08]|uniref:flavodoxin family protein n=1 Tax=Nostocoides sp. F2B08 TaxID=2653936 RepID=UPI0012634393|nr:NAD(P)H-dependent oxidoreductase [Tetrasphaera sp. F2B08]KAB7744678.1 flavodoxin family protein [Tetrasphaera sp. F2B08]